MRTVNHAHSYPAQLCNVNGTGKAFNAAGISKTIYVEYILITSYRHSVMSLTACTRAENRMIDRTEGVRLTQHIPRTAYLQKTQDMARGTRAANDYASL